MRVLCWALMVVVLPGCGMWGQHPSLQTGKAATAPSEQVPAAATTLSVEAKLVNLPVVVRDGKGVLAGGLTKADFSLQVDGKAQVIRYFDLDAPPPLTLGLLVDTSRSQRGVVDEERAASQAFLDGMLTGAKDQAFVLQFAREVELLQDVTGSKAKLQAALKELGTASTKGQEGTVDADDESERRGRAQRSGTALYDAVFLAADEVMAKQAGRKALILLTDGNDRNSRETITKAIEASQRGDTILYAIYFKGEALRPDRSLDDRDRNRYPGGGYPGGGYPGGGYPGGYPGGGYPGGGYPQGGDTERLPNARNDGKKILERMARETGGRMFEVTKKQPVGDVYAEIGKELRAQYRLGYTPETGAAEEGYHKVELELTGDRKKWVVQTREGYYAGK